MEIGKTVASEKFPNTIDGFWFALDQGVVVNPFDFITVEHVHHTKSIGMVQYSQTFVAENVNPHVILADRSTQDSSKLKDEAAEVIMAKAVVMGTMSKFGSNPVNMPVGLGKSVRFANAEPRILASLPLVIGIHSRYFFCGRHSRNYRIPRILIFLVI